MKKIYKKIHMHTFTFLASMLALFAPSGALAQTDTAGTPGSNLYGPPASLANNCPTGVICNPLKNISDIPSLVDTIMGYVVKVGGVIAIFAFIYSGYKFVEAQGKPEELKKAKDIFFYTCIGVAVLLGAQVIASLVVGTINNIQK